MELKLTLTFACCSCSDTVTAVLACRGEGLGDPDGEVVAAVNVECPGCKGLCQVVFDPHRQAVREVRPARSKQSVPTPSIN